MQRVAVLASELVREGIAMMQGLLRMLIELLWFGVVAVLATGALVFLYMRIKPSLRSPDESALEDGPARSRRCPHCGQLIGAGTWVCPGCLRDLKRNCPACGAAVDISANRCARCQVRLMR